MAAAVTGYWVCTECGTRVAEGALTCPRCGLLLVPSSRRWEPSAEPDPGPPAAGPQPADDVLRCPHCRFTIADPAARMCLRCLKELPAPSSGAAAGTTLEVRFPSGVIRVRPGSDVVLGRHGQQGSNRVLDGLDQVSRRHAVLRVRDGGAQIRDAGSRNGTFVDGVEVGRDWHDLPAGARLRLASDVVAEVRWAAGP